MPDDNGRILGDLNPEPDAADERPESMSGGSKHDRTRHSGSRDVTEGTSGGTGTEVGGSRNYRQGTGATGGDIGNRPE
jgi:hypothetical protein